MQFAKPYIKQDFISRRWCLLWLPINIKIERKRVANKPLIIVNKIGKQIHLAYFWTRLNLHLNRKKARHIYLKDGRWIVNLTLIILSLMQITIFAIRISSTIPFRCSNSIDWLWTKLQNRICDSNI